MTALDWVQTYPIPGLFPSEKVVTVQSDPGGSGVGNVYRLGWKEDCVDDADDVCEVRARSER